MPGTPLNRNAYTVGWITILAVEFTAARAMFDEEHPSPIIPSSDPYMYATGSVNGHNVVIVCSGEAGIAQASHCATKMKDSFPKIKISLLSGIGGGVPTKKQDIRLGDVVVSRPGQGHGGVACYDAGKITDDQFEPTGHLDRPPLVLRNAVTYLESNLGLGDSLFYDYLANVKPVDLVSIEHLSDELYEAGDVNTKVERVPRHTGSKPVIHHGLIASGSWVIKTSGSKRDDLVRRIRGDVLCFEMEAAGLMNTLPCLVVRGISDYCDSHKNDGWHKYAATTAACYCKWLLKVIKTEEVQRTPAAADVINQTNDDDQILREKVSDLDTVVSSQMKTQSKPTQSRETRPQAPERSKVQKDCLKSLFFTEISDRQKDLLIERMDHTCAWLTENSEYQQWLKTKTGQLWIKGNPGTGKSTLMSYILKRFKPQEALEEGEKAEEGKTITISFFFHGRGSHLQKGRLGMFRALLYQLLDQILDQQGLDCAEFVFTNFKKRCDSTGKQGSPGVPGKDWDWTPNELCLIFEELVFKVLKHRSLRIFIDALDECGEDEAVDLAHIFDELTSSLESVSTKFVFQVCISCRHYPDIAKHDLEIYVENENTEDIETFVQRRLRRIGLRKNQNLHDIEHQILAKAAGVFQWVSLVLDRVSQLYRRGKPSKQILLAIENIPPGLEKLYREILNDISQKEERSRSLKLMIWLYFSIRPLTVGELRFATTLDLDLKYAFPSLQALQEGDDYVEDDEAMAVSIRDLSCGLVEVVSHENEKIAQFIHQSVRDFMISEGFQILESSWKNPDMIIGNSHHCLARYCILFLALFVGMKFVNRKRNGKFGYENETQQRYVQAMDSSDPQIGFLRYTVLSWVQHTREADAKGLVQNGILEYLQWPSRSILDAWVYAYCAIHRYDVMTPTMGMNLLHIAAANGLENTLVTILKRDSTYQIEADSKDDYGRTPLSLAAQHGREAVVRLLLAHDDVQADSKDRYGQTPLSLAAQHGREAVVRLLLARDDVQADSNDFKYGQTPLSFAAQHGREAIVRLLLARNDIQADSKDDDGRTPLSFAAQYGREAIGRLLLARNDVQADSKDDDSRTPLSYAAEYGYEAIGRLLLERNDVQADSQDKIGRTPLSYAVRPENETLVRLLLERNDVQADLKDKIGRTPLSCAAEGGHETVVRLLLEHGVEADSRDRDSQTPLSYAAKGGHEAVVRLLLEHGVEADSRDRDSQTPLSYAAKYGYEAVVRMLLERGAAADSQDHDSRTPLSHAAEFGYGHEAVVQLLLERDVEADSKDYHGRTPLSYAAEEGPETIVRLLLENGAKADSKDNYGRTPLSYAAERGCEAVVKLLET